MKLDEKIIKSKLNYLLGKAPAAAYELALLYFISAKRKDSEKKALDTCQRSIYWLKKAGTILPENIKQLGPKGLLEEIERLLVINKLGVDARFGTA
jgi:hypothetical protein